MDIDIDTLNIISYPHPFLRKVCPPVEEFDVFIAKLSAHMLRLMHEAQGIGLASPQVGILLRLFVCNVTGNPDDDQVFVNPTLTAFEGTSEGEEGCLSIPDVTVTMRRHARCTLIAQDLRGRPIQRDGDELLARCWQHECDHLDGRLIIDHMSEADKIANRRALKTLESQYKRKAALRR